MVLDTLAQRDGAYQVYTWNVFLCASVYASGEVLCTIVKVQLIARALRIICELPWPGCLALSLWEDTDDTTL